MVADIEKRQQGTGPVWKARAIRWAAAWVGAWGVYMMVMVATVYDGLLSVICQPICGAVLSGAAVILGVILGLPLHLPYVRRVWTKHPWIAAFLGVTGLGLVLYSMMPGQMTEYREGPKVFHIVGPTCLPGYITFAFAGVNFPWPRRNAFGYGDEQDKRLKTCTVQSRDS